jgi:hypothetical protein
VPRQPSRLLERRRRQDGAGKDDIRGECDQFRCRTAHPVGIATAEAVIDLKGLTDVPTRLLQALLDGGNTVLRFRVVRREWYEHADATLPFDLLRTWGKRQHHRRGNRATNEPDELAPLELIELHLPTKQPRLERRISNCRGSVSQNAGYCTVTKLAVGRSPNGRMSKGETESTHRVHTMSIDCCHDAHHEQPRR